MDPERDRSGKILWPENEVGQGFRKSQKYIKKIENHANTHEIQRFFMWSVHAAANISLCLARVQRIIVRRSFRNVHA